MQAAGNQFPWFAGLTLVVTISSQVAVVEKPLPVIQETIIDGAGKDLYSIGHLVVGHDGKIFVSVVGQGRIRAFDSIGRDAGAFGRPGRGPGEFDYLLGSRLGMTGDTLWVYDPHVRRLTFVTPALRLLPDCFNGVAYRGDRLERWPSGPPRTNCRVAGRSAPSWRTVPKGARQREADRRLRVLSRIVDGVSAESRRHDSYRGQRKCFEPRRSHVGCDTVFPKVKYEASQDGQSVVLASIQAAAGGRATFRVSLIAANADTIFSVAYSYTPVRIPRRAVDSALAVVERMVSPDAWSAVREGASEADSRVLPSISRRSSRHRSHRLAAPPSQS